jgi:hypothetical protein
MNRDLVLYICLCAALCVIVGPGITFLSSYFTTTTRWLFILALFFVVASIPGSSHRLGLRSSFILLLYLAWIALSVIWSDVQRLSLFKAVAAVVATLAFYGAGFQIASRMDWKRTLYVFAPVSLLIFVTAVLGLQSTDAIDRSGSTIMYKGLSNHQNMFGLLLTIPMPLLLWLLHTYWKRPAMKFVIAGLLLLDLFFLYASLARSAMVLSIFIAAGFVVSIRHHQRFVLSSLLLLGLLVTSLLQPGLVSTSFERTVYKWEGQEVFSSRESTWRKSRIGAVHGGWTGLGYGISYGHREYEGTYTAVGYGREKGNTQLAVIEELGMVGLALYLMLLGSRLYSCARTFHRTRRGEDKLMLGVLMGVMIGFVAHSIFEAWWNSPGAVEFAYFWTYFGMLSGVDHVCRKQLSNKRHRLKAETLPRIQYVT